MRMQFSSKYRGKCDVHWVCSVPAGIISLVRTQNHLAAMPQCSCVLGGQCQTVSSPFILPHASPRPQQLSRPRAVDLVSVPVSHEKQTAVSSFQLAAPGVRYQHLIGLVGLPSGHRGQFRRFSSRRFLDSLRLRLSLLRLGESPAPAFDMTTG
ncbi:hypothetical protein VTI74DRAFT_6328 [Chaetomium olivicolor]